MSDTQQQLVYLREGHVSGHTLPLHPNVMERWKAGLLRRVNADGSPWQGEEYVLPGELPAADPGAPAAAASSDGGEPPRPRGNASRIEWAGYAVALGACTEDDAGKLTREELIALTTPPEEKPAGPAL
jgi:hypothetical protein